MQIIPKKSMPVEINWQKELARCFTTPESLLEYLCLDPQKYREHFAARRLFSMRVPRPFADLMTPGDWDDPLLQQVMPRVEEFEEVSGFVGDPLGEQDNEQAGILHKYLNRALLIVKGGCAVNCRYCFRRDFPYQENAVNKQQWLNVIQYIQNDTNLDEIILSGGDPLMAKDSHLAWLCEQISHIAHIKRLRIHTRLPVVIPQRINDEFLQWFSALRQQKIMVFHINHANEVSKSLIERCKRLREAGMTLLNQAVLLKGINDSADAQIALNEAVFSAGVLPYYLHLLDKVTGAAHFDMPEKEAKAIMAEVIKRQPGYLVPKLVREIAGQPGKTPIDLGLQPVP
ncbi:EF-P beta-lysylation protein EpmB [Glaciecola sp. XM2]|uniref:EF-P beta-lysylation protein EpmB n=1 Tax=Glaciecola sp. XM2 TaxID=1914931 RepID=UPI001BDF1EF8|nr:EF-P beta-lysylation protein EpmB [Glaciecola sp. XM2]MBT1450320.1 EF-P beta-lysylation protein EpmB [Glaciecola sp. XM2]